jgi:aconitate hydratase
MATPFDLVKKVYDEMPSRIQEGRVLLGHPLTLTEKILVSHLSSRKSQKLERKLSTVDLVPDRVAMQDATAQMALLQFMSSGITTVQIPSTVHCDHLIRAHKGSANDLTVAHDENKEVYDFLSSVSQKYGIGFWQPGAGIIHQVVLENYAFPGGLMIGTDSHTPNAGGLGMVAIGVGGADAVDAMVGEPFGLRWPGVIGVHLSGKMSGWTSAKDVILKLMSILTVKGGTHHIVEFFGDGTPSLSCTGKATICNMGAEHGATTSVFPYDKSMADYLSATGRADWAKLADGIASECLCADPEVIADPQKYYDKVVEIDLNTLEPYVVGPHTPDKARPISAFAEEIKKENYPDKFKYALIGSCTNSSYEDMSRAASVVNDALNKDLKMAAPLMVTPGSEQIFATIERDGQLATFQKAGATVLANACGPCIGQWQRDDIKKGERNSIINSYNRNFSARNDGNAETLSFISSPEITTALALAGRLSFNPLKDKLQNAQGEWVLLAEPRGDKLPAQGFDMRASGFIAPTGEGSKTEVLISPTSKRLQKLAAFKAWDGQDFIDLPILAKAQGKCTTDHISAAGPWLKYRGHLDHISDNMLLGATNAFTGEIGKGKNILTGETASFPKVARDYKTQGLGWIIIGDENYGEGSSREHAAMSPRFLGAQVVLVKSFARIHETNLKKQGVLPLTFKCARDYDKFAETDRVSFLGLKDLAPDRPIKVVIKHENGQTEEIEVEHTLTPEQTEWFKAGSALNRIAAKVKIR